jgi:hypothetical protein
VFLSRAIWIQSTHSHPTYSTSILILSSHQRLNLPSAFFLSGFPTKILYGFISPYVLFSLSNLSSFIWSPLESSFCSFFCLSVAFLGSYISLSTGLRAGWSESSTPGRNWEFFSSPPRPDLLWGPPSLLSNGTSVFFSLEVKRPVREADHSHQRMSGAIPPLPQYAFMAWCSVKSTRTTLPLPLPCSQTPWIYVPPL